MTELTQKQIVEKQLASAQAQKTILQNGYDLNMPQIDKRIALLNAQLAELE